MVEIVIKLFDEIEEQLSKKPTPKNLKEIGEFIRAKMFRAADADENLKKNGWKLTTGTKDIYLFKGITKEIAIKEIKSLRLDDIVEVDDL